MAGSRERRRRLAGAAIVVVVAASAAIAPTAIDHVQRADAGSTGAGAPPPVFEPDDATTAWIDRADAATSAAQTPSSARDTGPAGVDDAYGFGIVDAAAALDVGPHGTVAAPDLTGDASDLPSSPRVISVGTAVTEGLRLEFDQDWFAVDVPATAGAQITVTPPALPV